MADGAVDEQCFRSVRQSMGISLQTKIVFLKNMKLHEGRIMMFPPQKHSLVKNRSGETIRDFVLGDILLEVSCLLEVKTLIGGKLCIRG